MLSQWRIVQSPPSSVWLIFGLSAPSIQEAVGVSNKHHDFPLLGNLPAHHHALRFPEQLVCSPAEFKDPSRVKHPSKLEQGLSTMALIPRVCQGLCAPCAMERAMLRGRPTARHTSTALCSPTTCGMGIDSGLYLLPAPHR